jgi:hypothetical protein
MAVSPQMPWRPLHQGRHQLVERLVEFLDSFLIKCVSAVRLSTHFLALQQFVVLSDPANYPMAFVPQTGANEVSGTRNVS